MAYQVLARKWRPQTFDEIVGQEHVTTTLSNALDRGRVAHAYLFTGPRGCGKTTMARLMAKALNCDEGPTPRPCGKCPSCEGIAQGTFLDVMEIDAASNTGVDNIRELRENAQYQASAGKRRVFIIDEVHMLSKGAFNALLKTLEEPPEHVHFVFATTEPVRIPRTILSRCQRFDFRLFTLVELADRIRTITSEEKIPIQDDAIELLASMAEGSMRDALSLLDQAIASTDGDLSAAQVLELYGLVGHEAYVDLNEAVLAADPRAALDLVDGLVRGGHDLIEFARGLVANFRDLTLLRLDATLAERIDKPEAIKQQMAVQAARLDVPDWVHLAQRAAEHYSALERAPQPRWLFETQIVEYATMDRRVALSDVLGRLEALGGGAPISPSVGASAAPTKSAPPRPAARTKVSSASVAPVKSEAVPLSPSSAPAAGADDWSRFVAAVRQSNIGLGTCLVDAVPEWKGDTLRLVFDSDHAFQRQQAARTESLQVLAEVARQVYGRTITLSAISRAHANDETEMRGKVQEEVAPDADQDLARRAKENPHLGRLLDGIDGNDG
jgi:DNA polymerase-3 subunit gamma/tau